jgi:hypothetical protein
MMTSECHKVTATKEHEVVLITEECFASKQFCCHPGLDPGTSTDVKKEKC